MKHIKTIKIKEEPSSKMDRRYKKEDHTQYKSKGTAARKLCKEVAAENSNRLDCGAIGAQRFSKSTDKTRIDLISTEELEQCYKKRL
jgi:hypothetical protein